MEPLRITDLVKDYPARRALDGVSFEAAPGHRVGLLGPNGAGKTTLLSIIMGTLKPTSGTVTLGPHDPLRHARAWRRLFGVMPQSFDFPVALTGIEMLEQAALFHGLGVVAARRRALHLVDAFRFAEVAHRPAAGYSIGMKQRLAYACALVADPAVLLMDEPTSGLDPIERQLFRETLRGGIHEGQIVLLSTHIVADIEYCCDRVAVLGAGRLWFHGPVGDLAALARGRIWMAPASESDLIRWKAEGRLVSARPDGSAFHARILGDQPPAPQARLDDSTLEDGYRFLMMEHGMEATA